MWNYGPIIVLNKGSRTDRWDRVSTMLKEYNLPFERRGTVPFKYDYAIINELNTKYGAKFSAISELDCARNHYTIVADAYERGLDYVAVMEDDCTLINKDIFYKFVEAIPNTADIICFGALIAHDKTCLDSLNQTPNNPNWFQSNGHYCTTFYIMNRKGMEYYIACMQKFFVLADMPFAWYKNYKNVCNMVLPNYPLATQMLNFSTDIQTTDKLASFDNLFETYIDFNMFK